MSLALDDLPRDPEWLLRQLQQMAEVVATERSRNIALETERDALRAEHDAAQAEIEKLRLMIRQLQRGQFGRRSERLDPDQLCSWASRTSSRPWRRLRRRRKPL